MRMSCQQVADLEIHLNKQKWQSNRKMVAMWRSIVAAIWNLREGGAR